MREGVNFKYDEDQILEEMIDYIGSTYGQHYNTQKGIQGVDIWEALGSMETTSRDTAIKYLMRYGKKGGKNKADLQKAIHYIVFMLYCLKKEQDEKFIQDTINQEVVRSIVDKPWVEKVADTYIAEVAPDTYKPFTPDPNEHIPVMMPADEDGVHQMRWMTEEQLKAGRSTTEEYISERHTSGHAG